MKFLVVMPKASSYTNKSDVVQRVYNKAFKKWITYLNDLGCTFEYMLEDSLARDIFKELNISATVISCISNSDIAFFRNKQELVDIPSYVYDEYNTVVDKSGDVEKKYTVPMTLLKTDKDMFMKKRLEVFRKRTREATNDLVRGTKNVLMFNANSATNRCIPLNEQTTQGDGRLLMEFFLEKEFITCYYGGVYLPYDYIPDIIKSTL